MSWSCAQVSECPAATLHGVYTHGGQSYGAGDGGARDLEAVRGAVRAVSALERDAAVAAAEAVAAAGLLPASATAASFAVAVGSTPTCCLPPRDGKGLAGVSEVHPGNYVCLDTAQLALGSCPSGVGDVAVRVLTTVVGHYPASNTLQVTHRDSAIQNNMQRITGGEVAKCWRMGVCFAFSSARGRSFLLASG